MPQHVQRFSEIPGWLDDLAAFVTIDILNSQETTGLTAGLLEIGVYAGKFFSVLWQSAYQTNSPLVGVDPFIHFSVDAVLKNIGAPREVGQIHLVQGLSSDQDTSELIKMLGGAARFISIDGSHEYRDVYLDLVLSEQAMHPFGVVAVDDFLNTQCLGVVEAVVKFLLLPRKMVPFLFTAGKLFMCHPNQIEHYQRIVETGIGARNDSRSENFKERARHNREWLSTSFCGYTVFIL